MPAPLPLQIEKIIAKQLSKSVGKSFKQFLAQANALNRLTPVAHSFIKFYRKA